LSDRLLGRGNCLVLLEIGELAEEQNGFLMVGLHGVWNEETSIATTYGVLSTNVRTVALDSLDRDPTMERRAPLMLEVE
jgi:hypothetical protein